MQLRLCTATWTALLIAASAAAVPCTARAQSVEMGGIGPGGANDLTANVALLLMRTTIELNGERIFKGTLDSLSRSSVVLPPLKQYRNELRVTVEWSVAPPDMDWQLTFAQGAAAHLYGPSFLRSGRGGVVTLQTEGCKAGMGNSCDLGDLPLATIVLALLQ